LAEQLLFALFGGLRVAPFSRFGFLLFRLRLFVRLLERSFLFLARFTLLCCRTVIRLTWLPVAICCLAVP
jgi:hypothetical protein